MKIVPFAFIPDNRGKVCEVLEQALNWVRSPETDNLANLCCFVVLYEEHPEKVNGQPGSAFFYKDFHYINSVMGTIGALEIAKQEMFRGDDE
ncbi:MAG: hypothetical protein EBU08_00645 [Micrococcales bacterium]|nr:hypothetical protein [Micrococcales bacterium]